MGSWLPVIALLGFLLLNNLIPKFVLEKNLELAPTLEFDPKGVISTSVFASKIVKRQESLLHLLKRRSLLPTGWCVFNQLLSKL